MKQTPDLEAVVRRYNEASEALEAARADLQTAAVAALQSGAKQADIARATGWSREHLRRLREKAEAEAQKEEMEALRKKVEELSAPASAPPKETRPAVAAPRQQVTQAVPEHAAPPEWLDLTPEVAALSYERARKLFTTAESDHMGWGIEQRRELEHVPSGWRFHAGVHAGINAGLIDLADATEEKAG